MSPKEIARARIANQQVAKPSLQKERDLVRYMGAMQAQDYIMAKWAIGKRVPESTDASVERALAKGDILRTHLLRPTWHFIHSDDIRWLLALTAPNIRASLRSRQKGLGLTDAVIKQCNRIVENSLTGGALTREEIARSLERAHISTSVDNRLAHILLRAELDGVLCSGPQRGAKHTYALLDQRAPENPGLTHEEALAELAQRYFTSRGPATLDDFAWWSGLKMADARLALRLVEHQLAGETVDGRTYWHSGASPARMGRLPVQLLPAFDELVIGYRDRSAIVPATHLQKAISSNGIFRPTVVVNGMVAGLWRRKTEGSSVSIEVEFFRRLDRRFLQELEKAADQYSAFLDRPVKLAWKVIKD